MYRDEIVLLFSALSEAARGRICLSMRVRKRRSGEPWVGEVVCIRDEGAQQLQS